MMRPGAVRACCGIISWLAGERAFRGDSATDVVAAILKDDPAPLPAKVPPMLDTIIRRCLEKRSEERFSSAHDLGFALEADLNSAPARSPRQERQTGSRCG